MDLGVQLKTARTAWTIRSSETLPVPKVSTAIETGSATPMA